MQTITVNVNEKIITCSDLATAAFFQNFYKF